jgi:uncharacterized membrane protein YbhN (UPF0104 family)
MFKEYKLILTSVLLVGLFFFLKKQGVLFSSLKEVSLISVFALMFIHILGLVLMGTIFWKPLERISIKLNFKQWFGLITVSGLYNLIIPMKGGGFLRWFYLKESSNFNFRKFLGLTFYTTVIGAFTIGFLGASFLLLAPLGKTVLIRNMQEIFWFFVFIGSLLAFFPPDKLKVFKALRELDSRIRNHRMFINITLCFVGVILLGLLRTYLSFSSLGVSVDLFTCVELTIASLFITALPILPGNIGAREFILAYLGKYYGIEPEIIILASLMDRLSLYLFIIPSGLLFYNNLFIGLKTAPPAVDEIELKKTRSSF